MWAGKSIGSVVDDAGWRAPGASFYLLCSKLGILCLGAKKWQGEDKAGRHFAAVGICYGMAAPRVLSCSPNLELAQLRAAVLRSADCEVVCPVSQMDAVEIMKEERFDVLLLCYDYSEEAGQELCDEFKRQNPNGRIIALRKSHYDPSCHDKRDQVVHALDGPGALIRAVLAS